MLQNYSTFQLNAADEIVGTGEAYICEPNGDNCVDTNTSITFTGKTHERPIPLINFGPETGTGLVSSEIHILLISVAHRRSARVSEHSGHHALPVARPRSDSLI